MEELKISNANSQGNLDLTLARSDFLDAFSDLETQIHRILQSCGVPQSTAPFKQRLESFRSAGKTPLIAKSNFPDRDRIADTIVELLPVRADIVHSHMKPCLIDGEAAALFINSQEANSRHPTGRAISLVQLKAMLAQLNTIREQLVGLGRKATPASSPQPPLLGAAGGP